MKTQAKMRRGLCKASILSKRAILQIQRKINSIKEFEKHNRYFKILSDPTRHKMTILLNQFGPLCVCDIGNILDISPSAVSQHLRRLKDLDLVTSERKGQTIFYSLKTLSTCPLIRWL